MLLHYILKAIAMFAFTRFYGRVLTDLNEIMRWRKRDVILTTITRISYKTERSGNKPDSFICKAFRDEAVDQIYRESLITRQMGESGLFPGCSEHLLVSSNSLQHLLDCVIPEGNHTLFNGLAGNLGDIDISGR